MTTINNDINKVAAGNYSFVVTGTNRPFSNDFVMTKSAVRPYDGVDEVWCIVRCTAASKEPYRHYVCYYSTKGQLMSCSTLD